jgi:L-Lysine epsilon oxidase N-terminal/L-lysine epsilon oxidase C-terminal domain
MAHQVDCGPDPIEALRAMFVDLLMEGRIAKGQDPVLRPVFLKAHGVAGGTFTVREDLPEDLRVGLFLPGTRYPAWARFSTDALPTTADLRTTVGIGIKLFGVRGRKVLEGEEEATTADFLLQNVDVFFVDTAADFCEFTRAGLVGGGYGPYLAAHPVTKRLLDEMHRFVPSLLGVDYWSGLPSAFGPGRFVKYKLTPARPLDPPGPADDTGLGRNYLAVDLRTRLLAGPAAFDLSVQLQTDDERMPLDRATVRWDEAESPPVTVGTLELPAQDVDAPGQAAYGENLAFTSWHTLPDHRPAGSLAEARRVVYQASARRRRDANGIPVSEPGQPRPVQALDRALLRGVDATIVSAAIHPAIGIARVGDSHDDWFLGPEVPDPEPPPVGSYRDAAGALKRQAARFRVYGYDADGRVVRELTAADADVTWTVHVANTKAAWYQFQLALDIPDAADAIPSALRNAGVQDRSSLVIDPGPRSITGVDAHGPDHVFDTGEFRGRSVYLGELRTDEAGRLVFLGGRGVSASSDGEPADDFANNDDWHDDVSDGPVTAEVVLGGRRLPVEPAWVVVAPPNYGPGILSVRTMYDLLLDLFTTAGMVPFPERVSFSDHVSPILDRLCGLQWVNRGFAGQYGWGGREDFADAAYRRRLASPAAADQEVRRQVFSAFRVTARDGMSPVPWPWLYGDGMNLPPASPRQHLCLSATQYRYLQAWSAGKFDAPDGAAAPRSIEEVDVAEQPAMLDRAALDHCLADAFHPGCELTWPVRHLSMYSAPFRIRHRTAEDPPFAWPPVLTPEIALGPAGPLHGQGPGDLTRWMAVPWQCDTASCRDGYEARHDADYDPYLPTFWPARVPNQVLPEKNYDVVMDTSRSPEERRLAFEDRATWYRFLPGQYLEQINFMIPNFGRFGIVEPREGPGDGMFPGTILVESEVEFTEDPPHDANLHLIHVPAARDPAMAAEAVARAVEESPYEEHQVTAGYLQVVKRLRRFR